jgi:hypothetical protein
VERGVGERNQERAGLGERGGRAQLEEGLADNADAVAGDGQRGRRGERDGGSRVEELVFEQALIKDVALMWLDNEENACAVEGERQMVWAEEEGREEGEWQPEARRDEVTHVGFAYALWAAAMPSARPATVLFGGKQPGLMSGDAWKYPVAAQRCLSHVSTQCGTKTRRTVGQTHRWREATRSDRAPNEDEMVLNSTCLSAISPVPFGWCSR